MAAVIDYLPDMLKEIREFKALAESYDVSLKDATRALRKVYNEQFVAEADEQGLAVYERFLGISAGELDTIEERRFRIMARFYENAPYTLKSLEKNLAVLCGEDGFTINRELAEFYIKIRLSLTSKKNMKIVERLLERILPANMIYEVELMYNQWNMVSDKTWGELSERSWRDVREEAL